MRFGWTLLTSVDLEGSKQDVFSMIQLRLRYLFKISSALWTILKHPYIGWWLIGIKGSWWQNGKTILKENHSGRNRLLPTRLGVRVWLWNQAYLCLFFVQARWWLASCTISRNTENLSVKTGRSQIGLEQYKRQRGVMERHNHKASFQETNLHFPSF